MKLLLFSDIHSDTRACEILVEMAEDVDVVICAGDVGNIRRGLDQPIRILSQITQPCLLVPGNSESYEELAEACGNWPQAIVLHGSGITLKGQAFYGIGGGIPITPFGSWSYDFSEEQASRLLHNCPHDAVLISHSPPKGAVDISSRGVSLGSTTIRHTILAKSPKLVVCGHIHDSSGRHEFIGQTPVVNAGPRGMFWEIDQKE